MEKGKSSAQVARKFIFTKIEAPNRMEIFIERKLIPQFSLQRMAALIEAKKELDLKLRGIPGGNFELIGKLYEAFDEIIMDEFETAKLYENQ